MIRLVPRWRAGVALVASYALAFQTLLHIVVPLAQAWPHPHDGISIVTCLSSGHLPARGETPGAPAGDRDAACCVLCLSQGLDVAYAGGRVPTPDYQSSRSFQVTAWDGADPRHARELLLIKPRAPPRLV